jgi:hypothetical protein
MKLTKTIEAKNFLIVYKFKSKQNKNLRRKKIVSFLSWANCTLVYLQCFSFGYQRLQSFAFAENFKNSRGFVRIRRKFRNSEIIFLITNFKGLVSNLQFRNF